MQIVSYRTKNGGKMEEKILKILNNIIENERLENIPEKEKKEIKFNVNKNNSISFIVYGNIILKITFQKIICLLKLER